MDFSIATLGNTFKSSIRLSDNSDAPEFISYPFFKLPCSVRLIVYCSHTKEFMGMKISG